MRLQPNTKITLPLLAIVLMLGLSACGKSDKKSASQVAAKVNSEEISVHQINFVLSKANAGAIPPEQAPRVRREILDKLIDQQLIVEQAIEKKIDRSPETLMALEAARREILSRAYLEQIAAAQPKPTQEEAKKYIAEHPALFAERRVFNIQEIVLPVTANVTGNLRDMVAAGKSMEEIANWLKGKDIKFAGGSATRAAEQIPLDLLPKVHALKDGQGLVLENAQNVTAMRLVSSQSAPVAEAAAMPRVQQYLGNKRAGEAAESDLKQIKGKAKITYMGEFADGAAVPAVVPAPAPAKVEPAKTEPAKKSVEPVSKAIEKGAAGLK